MRRSRASSLISSAATSLSTAGTPTNATTSNAPPRSPGADFSTSTAATPAARSDSAPRPGLLPVRSRPRRHRRGVAPRQRRRLLAARPHRGRAGERPAPRALHRPGLRFRRGAMDARRRDRRGGAGARPRRVALRTLQLAWRGGVSGPPALRHAVRVRRPCREEAMTTARSDALVFFGATGDLAYKKIFPALQAMARRGHLDVPVIGVAKSGWTLDQMRARARDSVTKHGGLDAAAFAKLESQLRYVGGDYRDPSTYAALRKALGDARRPAHYLAIPPSMFATVVEGLERSGAARDARVIIEKPFGRDLESARALNGTLRAAFDEADVFRIDHYLRKGPV